VLRPVALRLSEIIQLATLRQALDLLTRTHNLPGLPARVTETLRIPAGAVRRAIQNLLSNQDHSRDRRCHPRPQDTIPDDRKNPREPMSGGEEVVVAVATILTTQTSIQSGCVLNVGGNRSTCRRHKCPGSVHSTILV
jgi:hypothetical protein